MLGEPIRDTADDIDPARVALATGAGLLITGIAAETAGIVALALKAVDHINDRL